MRRILCILRTILSLQLKSYYFNFLCTLIFFYYNETVKSDLNRTNLFVKSNYVVWEEEDII